MLGGGGGGGGDENVVEMIFYNKNTDGSNVEMDYAHYNVYRSCLPIYGIAMLFVSWWF